jgi:hypothetical protein
MLVVSLDRELELFNSDEDDALDSTDDTIVVGTDTLEDGAVLTEGEV